MSLDTIAQTLQGEAADDGVITLDDALLGSGGAFALFVETNLRRPEGNVLLRASDIPDCDGCSSFTFPAGMPINIANGFLGLLANAVTVTIWEVNGVTQVELDIALTERYEGGVEPWVFSRSYPELLGWYFDHLPLSDQCFEVVFAPEQAPEGLPEGVNFSGDYTLTGLLAPVATLLAVLEKNGDPQPMTGVMIPVGTEAEPRIAFDLVGGLDLKLLGLTALKIERPHVTASMDWVRPENAPEGVPFVPVGFVAIGGITTLRRGGQEGGGGDDFERVVGALAEKTRDSPVIALKVVILFSVTTTSNLMQLQIVPADDISTSLNNLGEWMAGQSWDEFFATYPASTLQPFLETFGLQSYSLTLSTDQPTILSTTLSVGTLTPWVITENQLVVPYFSAAWALIDPFGSAVNTISLEAVLHLIDQDAGNTIVFDGAIQLPALTLSLGLRPDQLFGPNSQDLTAAEWVQTLVSALGGHELPSYISDALAPFILHAMTLELHEPAKDMTFTLSGAFTVGDNPVDFELFLHINILEKFLYDIRVAFILGGASIKGEITNENESGSTQMLCSWSSAVNPLRLIDIAVVLGFDDLGIPKAFDAGVNSIALTYDLTNDIFGIAASSAEYGSADVLVFQPEGSPDFALFGGLNVDMPIDLTNLPVVGGALSGLSRVEVRDLQVQFSSVLFNEDQAQQLNGIVAGMGSGYPDVPAEGMASTVNISMLLDVAGFQLPLGLGAGGTSDSSDSSVPADSSSVQGEPAGLAAAAVPTTSGDSTDGTTWFNVQKAVGPLMFRRIGVRFEESVLWFVLDASLKTGGVNLDLLGAGVGSPLSRFEPMFTIDGLGVAVVAPGFEVAGGLMRRPPSPGLDFEFAGGAVLRASTFGISAIGSYAQMSGVPSMFIFGQVTGAFGGPPALFVTGLAGGFGYNSQLRLPGMNEIFQFPLVAGAQDPSAIGGPDAAPMEVVDALLNPASGAPWLSHSIGQYWFAAGLQFTSFELVATNALAVLEFGNSLRFGLLGLSRSVFPMAGSETYAFIEMQLRAVVDVDQGSLEVSAVLSPNSYLLDPTCELAGGFAFATWFGSNPHAGDFCITVGGYHPSFDPPAWYPQVPKVGFGWSLDSTISITGEAYFAMTPQAAMAGGKLAATYQDGALRAWFKAWADMLLYWNPFHFDIVIGLTVGAAYTFNLGFTTKTVSTEMGASLLLWGPPTGGKVHVSWTVISFTIEFGAARTPEPPALTWTEFLPQLPAAADIIRMAAGAGLAANGNSDLAAGPWAVRPKGFAMTVTSAVPNSELLIEGSSPTIRDLIDIRPMQDFSRAGRDTHDMGTPSSGVDFVSTQQLTMTRDGNDFDLVGEGWTVKPKTAAVAVALWGVGPRSELFDADEQLVPDQLVGFELRSPETALGATPGVIAADNLVADVLSPTGTLPIQPGQDPEGPIAETADNSIETIETTIASQDGSTARAQLFAALQDLGVDPLTNQDMQPFANVAGSLFTTEPLIVPSS
jgi:hypothetical protein